MTCPRCQAANRDGARFCRECGATFSAVCAACGAKVDAVSKFCDSCGAPLAATPPRPAAATPRYGPPESYTPKHLAEKILTSKAALEGERKQVTVLFADLKGSLGLGRHALDDLQLERTQTDSPVSNIQLRQEEEAIQALISGWTLRFRAHQAFGPTIIRGCGRE